MQRRDFLKGGIAAMTLASVAHSGETGARRPNVLWLFTDEQRTDSLGCYGSPWAHTPALERLECLTRLFERAGYRTAGVGRNHWCCSNRPFQTVWTKHLSRHLNWFDYADEYDEAAFEVVKYPGEPYHWIFGGRFPADASETSE